MQKRIIHRHHAFYASVLFVLLSLSCGGIPEIFQAPATPGSTVVLRTLTPDAVATGVAQAKAVAATLTADALASQPTPIPTVPPTLTPPPTLAPTPVPPSATPTVAPTPTLPPVPPPVQPPASSAVFFNLINRHTQKCLTALGGIGNPVVQESCGVGRDDQLWYLPEGVTQVSLQSKSGACIGYDPSGAHNTLFQVGCSGYKPWSVQETCTSYYSCPNPITSPHNNPIIAPMALGRYYLIEYSGDCVDVDGWKHDEDVNIIHTQCRYSDNDNQLWARY